MRNILIPTDFSENSHNAIRYALDYFENTTVNFFVLNVSSKNQSVRDGISDTIFDQPGNAPLVYPSSSLLNEIKICKKLTRNPNHKFYPLQEDRALVDSIRRQISEKEIDLIIMGTKGDSQSKHDEMGSHTYDVITKVKCPILVIPENASFMGIKNIAFVTDYHSIYRNRIFNTLSEALKQHNSPLRVLHIRPQNTTLTAGQIDNKGFLHYFFKDTKHSFHFLENQNIETGIQDFVDTWEISIVAIVAKNLNFIQRLMLRPSPGEINYHTEVPFLVLHE